MKTKAGTTTDFLTSIRTGQPLSTVEEFTNKQSLTKHERFRKYAGGRAAQALRAIELIGNCANPANYEYSPDEVTKMFDQLYETLSETKAKFQPKSRQRFGRNFFEKEGN